MRLLRCRALLLGGILLGFTSSLTAQATMTGIVREDSSARPLEGVEVLINGTAHRTITGANGRYLLEGLPAGIYQVIFRGVGHLPERIDVRLVDGETTRANAMLVRSDVVLAPIEVTGATLTGLAGRGFEERRRMGVGRFYDSEELRRMEHLKVGDVLRRKGGVEIKVEGRVMIAMHPASRNRMGQLNCYMSVFLDAHLHWRGGNQFTTEELRDNPPPDLATLVSVHQVEAIEVYRSSAQLPVQFVGASGQCGAVVLWTRRTP
jgi:hypothetical protein